MHEIGGGLVLNKYQYLPLWPRGDPRCPLNFETMVVHQLNEYCNMTMSALYPLSGTLSI